MSWFFKIRSWLLHQNQKSLLFKALRKFVNYQKGVWQDSWRVIQSIIPGPTDLPSKKYVIFLSKKWYSCPERVVHQKNTLKFATESSGFLFLLYWALPWPGSGMTFSLCPTVIDPAFVLTYCDFVLTYRSKTDTNALVSVLDLSLISVNSNEIFTTPPSTFFSKVKFSSFFRNEIFMARWRHIKCRPYKDFLENDKSF